MLACRRVRVLGPGQAAREAAANIGASLSPALAKEAEALEAVAVPDEDWDESAEEAADRAAAEMEEVEAE